MYPTETPGVRAPTFPNPTIASTLLLLLRLQLIIGCSSVGILAIYDNTVAYRISSAYPVLLRCRLRVALYLQEAATQRATLALARGAPAPHRTV